jgi:hypothetical protein
VVQLGIRWEVSTTEGESVMGYIEVYNIDKDGEWTDLDDIPMMTVINCQLCNEPTEAHDIIIPAVIKDGVLTAGTWQCRKCKAVNG